MRLIKLLLVLLLTATCYGELVRYVDTDVSGGDQDGRDWPNAFASLKDWETWEEASGTTDLVTTTENIVVHLRGSATDAFAVDDYIGLSSTTFTTSTDYKITFIVAGADRHSGVRNTGYRMSCSKSFGAAFYIDGVRK